MPVDVQAVSADVLIVLSPAAVGVAFLGLVVFSAVVFLAGALSVWPYRSAEGAAGAAELDVECAETVEIPQVPHRRLGPRAVSAVHAPQYHRSGDDTVPIGPMEAHR